MWIITTINANSNISDLDFVKNIINSLVDNAMSCIENKTRSIYTKKDNIRKRKRFETFRGLGKT